MAFDRYAVEGEAFIQTSLQKTFNSTKAYQQNGTKHTYHSSRLSFFSCPNPSFLVPCTHSFLKVELVWKR